MRMSNGNFSFHLDIIDREIVDRIRSSIEDIMPDIMADNNLQERNGYGQFRWNVIITQLRDMCRHIGWLDVHTCSRGGWKTPVLYHPASRNIITFMTEDTLCKVQRKADKGKHYLCGGASYNPPVSAQHEQLKMSLPSISSDMEKWVAKSREQLANAVHLDVGEIEGHILVLFDVHADRLLSVRAVRLTQDLEISAEEEDWSKYISVPYMVEQPIQPQQIREDDDEELVELL